MSNIGRNAGRHIRQFDYSQLTLQTSGKPLEILYRFVWNASWSVFSLQEQVPIRRYHIESESSDEEYQALREPADIGLTNDGHEERLVLMSAIAPLAHCYLATAKSLHRLINVSRLETDFVNLCIEEITARVNSGDCKYGMCANFDELELYITDNFNFFYLQARAYRLTPSAIV